VSAAQTLAMAHLSNGDLAGARGALSAAVARGIPSLKIGIQMAGFFEVGFALAEGDQQRCCGSHRTLSTTRGRGGRSRWPRCYWQRGDTARARAYADSALGPTRQLLAETPNDLQLHGIVALMLAYVGRAAEARSESARALVVSGSSDLRSYNRLNAVKTEVALGDRDAAVAHLKALRPLGTYATGGWLRVDPTFASLRDYPPAATYMKPASP
jgi:hypothetical protein